MASPTSPVASVSVNVVQYNILLPQIALGVNSYSPCKSWCEGKSLLYHPSEGGSHVSMKSSCQGRTSHPTHKSKQKEDPACLGDQSRT